MAGVKYDPAPQVERELCDASTIKRMTGGVNLKTTLPGDFRIPPLAPLAVTIDDTKREAELVVRIPFDGSGPFGTSMTGGPGDKLKVVKGAPVMPGMHISDGKNTFTVKTVDTTSEAEKDIIEATAPISGFTSPAVLFEAKDDSGNKPKAVATHLNYSWQTVGQARSSGLTPIYRAFEVRESKLYMPLIKADKQSLRENGVYVFTY